MYNKPLVVGVRQAEAVEGSRDPAAALNNLGRNTGNMMFTQALVQVLDGARLGSFAFSPADLDGRDSIVLAAANWINSFEDFTWLVDRLEKIDLPVFLVGVGAQATLRLETPVLKPGTQRLLDLVRDRSISIAARGGFTCEILEKLGVPTGTETGCPSLMLAGPTGPQIKSDVISEETCCLHATRHGFQKGDAFQDYLYRQAFQRRMNLILQSELSDIYYALNNANTTAIPEKGFDALRQSYDTADIEAIGQYLTQCGHVFLNYQDWIAYMQTRSFCFGTRVHGTIASLLAGTPATLICHDSRTLELARSMSLPMVLSTEIDTTGALSLTRLYEPEKNNTFIADYGKYYDRFIAYFEANGLVVSSAFKQFNLRLPVTDATERV